MAEFDQYANNYDRLLQGSLPPGVEGGEYLAEYKVWLCSLKLRQKNIQRILDFGCGSGRSIQFLKKYFPAAEVYGFDPSETSLQLARVAHPNAVFVQSMDLLPRDFDLILLANVLHHIPVNARSEVLVRCRDSLSTDGSVFVFEHNPRNPVTKWVFERCPFDVNAVMLDRREAELVVDRARFHIQGGGYTLFFPWAFKLFRSLELALEWCPLGAQYYLHLEK